MSGISDRSPTGAAADPYDGWESLFADEVELAEAIERFKPWETTIAAAQGRWFSYHDDQLSLRLEHRHLEISAGKTWPELDGVRCFLGTPTRFSVDGIDYRLSIHAQNSDFTPPETTALMAKILPDGDEEYVLLTRTPRSARER